MSAVNSMETTNTRYTATSTRPTMTDLLLRARGGDREAWDEIVRRYSGLVRATVRSHRLQHHDALDAVQMTWLRLVEQAPRVQFPDRLGAWLVTTARRECLRISHERARPTSGCIDIDTVAETVADPSAGPEQRLIDADIAENLRNLLAELPARSQVLLRALFTDDPQPYSEISRAIGIPIGSIGPVRARTLAQLRRLGGKHGLGDAA
jgi:RNA polymerase sigma factor (sigma-70 family)